MEESKRKWNDQKKMTLKVGGGGIGAVVLLGGALATAALASAFVVGKKRRSSGKEHRRRRQSPPPEINKQDEEDKANKGHRFIFVDQPSDLYELPSGGATEEVESDNDIALLASTQSSTLDEKPRVEEICDIEASEQILCSISPKKLETAISDGSVVTEEGFPLLDEKLQFEPQNMMQEDDEVKIDHLTKQDIPNEISKESENLEQVHIEEESIERESSDDGEIEGTSHEEAFEITEKQSREEENNEVCYDHDDIKVIVVDNAVIEGKVNLEKREFEGFNNDNGDISEGRILEASEIICNNQETMATGGSLSDNIFAESHIEDGQKTLVPMFDSPVIEHENVNEDDKEGPLDTKIVEIIQEDEQVKYNEAQMVKEEEEENCDQPDEGIVAEKCEDPIEVKEDKIPCENGQFELPMLKEEQISTKDIEVTKEDDANGEVAESLELNETSTQFVMCQPKENEDNAKENIAKEAGEELISPGNIEVAEEDGVNEEVAELNETSMQFVVVCQPKDNENDAKKNIEKEAGEELISPENIEVAKEDGTNEEVAESVELNETTMQFVICQPKENEDNAKENIAKEAGEELISPENIEVRKEYGANEEVAESVELNETPMQFVICQPKDNENDAMKNIAMETEEELISSEDAEVTKEDGVNKEVAESVEVNEYNSSIMQFVICQPKDHEDNLERNIEKEVEKELICPENIEVTKDDATNGEVAESTEVNENKTSVEFVVGQPKQDEDYVEKNITEKVEDSSETIDTGIGTEKDDSTHTKDSNDETALSDEVQLIDQEVEGKIQEDKTVKKGEHASKDSRKIDEDSSFEPHQSKEESNFQKSSKTEKTSINKYIEMAMLRDHTANSTSRRIIIATLSVLSSLSCSWFFGLSFVKLCFIVFFTMALSSMVTV